MTEEFEFVPLKDCQAIRSEWIDQIKDRRFTEEQFRTHMVNRAQDASNTLFGITANHVLCGFIWGEYNSLEDVLFINTIVIDKTFPRSRKAFKSVIKFLKELVLHLRVKGIIICSSHEKLMLAEGCKPHPEKMWFYKNPHAPKCPCRQIKIWGKANTWECE